MAAPSDDLPVVFVHIMKTAGTTLVDQLAEHLGRDAVWPHAGEAAGGGEGPTGLAYVMPQALLGAPVEELLAHRVIAGHHAAAVVDVLAERFGRRPPAFTALRHPVKRVVSHLRQVAAGEGTDDLEAVYHDVRFHEPLFCDLQTKVLSATADELLEPPAGSAPARLAASHPDEVRDAVVAYGDGADEAVLAEIASRLPEGWDAARIRRSMVTPMAWWVPVDDRRVAAARRRLEQLDVVGVTGRYDELVAALEQRFGWSLPPLAPRRRAADRRPPPDALLRRIEQDNANDLAVFEHARRLAA